MINDTEWMISKAYLIFRLVVLLSTLCEVYIKHNLKKMKVHMIEEMNLIEYTTTSYDIKKTIRRIVPKNCQEMTVEDIKEVMQELRGKT